MRMMVLFFAVMVINLNANAQYPEGFTTGPVFDNFGPVHDVDLSEPLPSDIQLRHAFDISDAAEEGEANRKIASAARFVNMHARAGVNPENISVAVIIHGAATSGAMNANADAPTAKLIAALIARGDRVIVCGQSAAAYGYDKGDLLPEVEMAMSAMTAHAILQQDGYTLNPF